MIRPLWQGFGAFALALFVSALVSPAQACSLCDDVADTAFADAQSGIASAASVAFAPAPGLSSRPGAAYTVYLNFDGFTYSGNWSGRPPGVVPAYTGTTAQLTEAWARVAEKYAAFDVNVTTVDPSGFAPADYLSRQNYYDATPRVMQTIIGGNNGWYGNAGGVSYVNVFRNSYPAGSGRHTNWAFPLNLGNNNPKSVAEAVTHEAGHGFGLRHQNDHNLNPDNTYSTNNGATGVGSYAPQMGVTYNSQRGAWRVGTFAGGGGALQNDVATILNNPDLALVDSGYGHSFDAATALSLTGAPLDAVSGVIVPLSASAPNPLGIENYTRDFFRFSLAAPGTVSLSLLNGGDWITPGVAAPGATLRSRLNLYREGNRATPFAFGIEATDTLSSSFSALLETGDYFAEVTGFGGYASTYDTSAKYFDMGSYVLRGSIAPVVVPENGTFALAGVGLAALVVLRRRKLSRVKMV